MGFYEIGNGCDSCATVGTPQVQNYNGNTNGFMSSVPVSGAVNVPMAQQQPQVQQVVQQTATVQPENKPVVPAPQQVVQSINRRGGNGLVTGPQVNVNLPSTMFYLNMCLVVLTALAANECFKYFINKSIQVNDGNPLYFVGYAVLTALLAFAVHSYAAKRN
jgi:hypothetical protein